MKSLVEELNDTVEKWEDRASRMAAEADFHILNKDFDKAQAVRTKLNLVIKFADALRDMHALATTEFLNEPGPENS
jgi:hypothetical protein